MAKTIPNEEKVFMVSKSTNTTYSGSASLKAMQEWYTMEDVANTVKPYKVFTALLTQSGGEASINVGSGTLVIGATYQIVLDSPGMDFTNVGAQNNNVGTWFVATGITPTSWGNLEGDKILYYHPAAPVVTVLENTIGNIWFTYLDVGQYYLNSDNLFINNKTYCSATLSNYSYDNTNVMLGRDNDSIVRMITLLAGDALFDDSDTSIEIRVYN